MTFRFVTLPPTLTRGISGETPSSFAPDADAAVPLIEALWGQLFKALGSFPGDPQWEFVGMTSPLGEVTPPLRLTYCAAIIPRETDSVPDKLDTVVLDEGLYAVARYEGAHDGLDDFYRRTYLEDLASAGLVTRPGLHLEKYPTPSSPDVMVTEAWIPIFPASN